MRHAARVTLLALAGLLAACAPGTAANRPPTAPAVTVAEGAPAPVVTLPPGEEALLPALTPLPTATRAPGAQLLEPVTSVQLFFVAPGDNGQTGPDLGCGNSLVPVERRVDPTLQPLSVAMELLLALPDDAGPQGLRNALGGSGLRLEGVDVTDTGIVVRLAGTLPPLAECEARAARAQLLATARQLLEVPTTVLLDGSPLVE